MPKTKPLPSQEELQEHFDYEDGKLLRKDIRFQRKRTSEPSWRNYHTTSFKGESYRTHRLVYKFHFGDFNENWVIDHVNGNRQDNRIENLRACTQRVNGSLIGGYLLGDYPLRNDGKAYVIPCSSKGSKENPDYFKVIIVKCIFRGLEEQRDWSEFSHLEPINLNGYKQFGSTTDRHGKSEYDDTLWYKILCQTRNEGKAHLVSRFYNWYFSELLLDKRRNSKGYFRGYDHDEYEWRQFLKTEHDVDWDEIDVKDLSTTAEVESSYSDWTFRYSQQGKYYWVDFLPEQCISDIFICEPLLRNSRFLGNRETKKKYSIPDECSFSRYQLRPELLTEKDEINNRKVRVELLTDMRLKQAS